MGFSSGNTKIVTTVTMVGTVPPGGNAPSNTLPSTTGTPTSTTIQSLPYGVSSGQNDVFCAGEFLLAPSATLTLNLYDGGATTSDLVRIVTGAAAAMVLAKSLTFAVVSDGDRNGVAVGGAASDEFFAYFGAAGDKVKIFPRGPTLPFGCDDGQVVSATAKNVKLENLSASVSVVVRVTASGTSVAPGMAMGPLGSVYS